MQQHPYSRYPAEYQYPPQEYQPEYQPEYQQGYYAPEPHQSQGPQSANPFLAPPDRSEPLLGDPGRRGRHQRYLQFLSLELRLPRPGPPPRWARNWNGCWCPKARLRLLSQPQQKHQHWSRNPQRSTPSWWRLRLKWTRFNGLLSPACASWWSPEEHILSRNLVH